MISALPEIITLEEKAVVQAVREAFIALTPDQQALVSADILNKPTGAETIIADREAAKAVENMIDALPEADDITLADKEAVTAANATHLNLTPAQMNYYTFIAIDKLFKAHDKKTETSKSQRWLRTRSMSCPQSTT